MPEKRASIPDEVLQDLIPDEGHGKVESYSVVLESIRSDIETFDSFALKLSVLLKQPITKVKHLVRRLPHTLWKGTSMSKAKMLLELIEEAGGIARIEENHSAAVGRNGNENQQEPPCRKCGFPLKKDDKYCAFCMTPVKESVEKPLNHPVVEKKTPIPLPRLLFYLIVVGAVIILALILR